MRSRRRTHHSHVAWSGSDEEFQSQTPQPAWDAAWDRVRAERKQAGLPNAYSSARSGKGERAIPIESRIDKLSKGRRSRWLQRKPLRPFGFGKLRLRENRRF